MTVFFDTNILVYASVQDDPRQAIARHLLRGGGLISAQVLNEFVNVARRKLKFGWAEIHSALLAVRSAFPVPSSITVATHDLAVALAERHKFAFYDALIVASALEAKCDTLFSEDMQHGMMVGGSLRIVNPFVDPSS